MAGEKQHYFPRFLQRPFAFDDKKRQIWTYDKKRGKSFSQGISKAAQSSWYYRLHKRFEHAHPNFADDFLTKLETAYAPRFQRLLEMLEQGTEEQLAEEDRTGIAELVVLQLLRSPKMRRMTGMHFIESMLTEAELEAPPLPMVLEDEVEKMLHTTVMFGPHTIERMNYWRAGWMVFLEAPKESEFLTSESPVLTAMTTFKPANKRVKTLFMPLTPRVAVELIREKPDGAFEDKERMKLTGKQTRDWNRRTIANSPRLVFSKTQNFKLAKQMLVEEPKVYASGYIEKPEVAFTLTMSMPEED